MGYFLSFKYSKRSQTLDYPYTIIWPLKKTKGQFYKQNYKRTFVFIYNNKYY